MHAVVRTLSVGWVLTTLLGTLLLGDALHAASVELPKNEQAVREVREGRRTEARASWWGFHSDDSTAPLQAAIRSGAAKIIVEKMPAPWVVTPIQLVGNQEIVFEPGAEVVAKKGEFRGKADSLFSARNVKNLKLIGPGAVLRMQRADYDGPDYSHAEWRHVLNFHGCSDVVVDGLTLADSGGDGVYLGAGRGGETNRNVVLRNLVCDRNYRQGISVITAEDLLIEDCTLKNTHGTPPAAGIDFEPNLPRERLVRCVMRRCVIENNTGYAIHIYAKPLNAGSEPISIRFEDCVTRGTHARSMSLITGCGEAGPVRGLVEVVRCRFEDAERMGLHIGSKPARGVKLRLVDCTLADSAERPKLPAPILLATTAEDTENVGGIEFVRCTLRERIERPVLQSSDLTGRRLHDITGTLTVERGGRRVVHTIDQALIDRWIPFDPALEVPIVGVKEVRLASAKPPAGATPRPLPAHRLRGRADYLLEASHGDSVVLRFKSAAVGRSEGSSPIVRVLNSAGKELHRVTIPFGREAECRFTADGAGPFTLTSKPEGHTLQLVASTHPVGIVGVERGGIHFLGVPGEFYFRVPADAPRFAVRFYGEGDAERVSAAVFDPTGRKVWERADIAGSQSFLAEPTNDRPAGIWRVRSAKPRVGVLEDYRVELRGVPPVLGFNAESLAPPAK